MQPTYILQAKRTPIGKFGKSFLDISAPKLLGNLILEGLSKQSREAIEELVVGNVLQANLGQNPARQVARFAKIPEAVPGYLVNAVCGSGTKAVHNVALALAANENPALAIAAGMENMSNAPFYLENHRFGNKLGDGKLIDAMIKDGLWCAACDTHMGITAENIADKYGISREEQDKFALESHQKATAAIKNGKFENEIVPVKVKNRKEIITITTDEGPRGDTTLEALAKLKPVFKKDGSVTAGNASSINDGASFTLLANESYINTSGENPMAKIIATASVGVDPAFMGEGAAEAAKRCLQNAGLKVADIDLFEVNEAFASQTLHTIQELKISPEKLNINGGAIALGHPIGASGNRILVTLAHDLVAEKKRYGLATACVGGGQGYATIIENTNF